MKESLQRLTVWAKEHPYLAGIILLAVGVLAYITVKNGGGLGGGSGSVSSDQSATDQTDQSAAPLGSGSLSDLSGSGSSSGSSDNQTPAPIGAGGGDQSANDNAANLYGGDPNDYTTIPAGSYAYAQGAPVSSVGMDSLHLQDFTPAPVSPVSPIAQATSAHPQLASASKQAPSAIAQAVASHPTLQSAAKPQPKAQTDSEKVGKGPRFTGYFQGLYYLNGWRVNNPNSTIQQAVTLHPGLASAARTGQGGTTGSSSGSKSKAR